MSKVYVLYEKDGTNSEEERKLCGVVTDFFVASAWVSTDYDIKAVKSWQSTELNSPELLNRIAKLNKI